MRKNTYISAIFFTKLFFIKIEEPLDMFNLSGNKPF